MTDAGLARAAHTHPALANSASGHPEWIWRNGALVPWEQATVHVNAVGHASVAAIFEGIKAYLTADRGLLVFRLDDHLRRFYESARICRLNIPLADHELRAAILLLLQSNRCHRDTYIRPWAYPTGIIREPMVPADAECDVVIDSWSFQSQLAVARACRAMVSSWRRIGEGSMPPRVKAFSNYHNGRLAVIEAHACGHDWPILLNEQGKVSEGPGACVGLVRSGVFITPSLTSGVLESITRSTVLDLLRTARIPVEEREVDRSELYLADELFYMGTGWEILPVSSIDGLPLGDGRAGRVTACIQRAYLDLVRGNSGRHEEWLTPVYNGR